MGEILARYDFVGAFWLTIQLSFWSALGALMIGTVLAVLRVSPVPVQSVRTPTMAYVEGSSKAVATVMGTP